MNTVTLTDEDLARMERELSRLPDTAQGAPITAGVARSLVQEVQQRRSEANANRTEQQTGDK